MKRSRGLLTVLLAVRMTEELAGLLDEYAAELQRRAGEDWRVTRSDALRLILERALRKWRERRRASSRPARAA